MNYLIGFIIFVEGLSIMMDPNPPINLFGIPKGDTIPYSLNIPVGLLMILFGIFFIYREIKKISRVSRDAFVNSSSTKLYSQLKDRSKDVDKDRILIKAGVGGLIGYGASHMGKIGEKNTWQL